LMSGNKDLDTTESSMFHKLKLEAPFRNLEEARRALLIGD
jgi:hypothetical protein